MYLAASEQRNSTASDTSLGSIQATPGRMFSPSNASRTSSSPGFSTSGANSSNVESLITSGVLTVVGHTALTRIPCGPHSCARTFMSPMTLLLVRTRCAGLPGSGALLFTK